MSKALNHYVVTYLTTDTSEVDVYATGYYQDHGFFIFEAGQGADSVVYSANDCYVRSIELKGQGDNNGQANT